MRRKGCRDCRKARVLLSGRGNPNYMDWPSAIAHLKTCPKARDEDKELVLNAKPSASPCKERKTWGWQ